MNDEQQEERTDIQRQRQARLIPPSIAPSLVKVARDPSDSRPVWRENGVGAPDDGNIAKGMICPSSWQIRSDSETISLSEVVLNLLHWSRKSSGF